MAVVSMKQLLEAGVHFGHQTRRWNPKMKPFIYTERNGIHIIDLQKTVGALDRAYDYVQDVTRQGGRVLFVGTKKQAQEAIAEEAARAGQFYVNQRWLGGLLTNFRTIQERLRRLEELERMNENGVSDRLTKKEQLRLDDERTKLNRMLGGIRGMRRLPDVLFVVDTRKEHIAIHEAERLDIPVVALVDTNSDPDEVTYPIPANDDAIRAVRLLSGKIADAAAEGTREYASTVAKEEAEEGFEPSAYEGYTFEPEGYESSIDVLDEDVDQPVAAEGVDLASDGDTVVEADAPQSSVDAAPTNRAAVGANASGDGNSTSTDGAGVSPEAEAEAQAAVEDTAVQAAGAEVPPAAEESEPGIHPDPAE